MPTTSNFGWTTPADTDLVKDGAAAIRTLGNGIDTSLIDLKGGTTGQILSKASNTDLDYTWINNDQGDITAVTAGTGISGGGTTGAVTITNDMATTITAAGDIVVGTGSGTYDNLPIGTTGQVLTADTSVSPYKVKWEAVSAGGMTSISSTALSGSSISLTSISGSYRSLYLYIRNVQASSDYNLVIEPNGTANTGRWGAATMPGATPQINGVATTWRANLYNKIKASNGNNSFIIQIYEYASSVAYKPMHFFGGYYSDANQDEAGIAGGYWFSNTAITSLTISTSAGTFSAGTVDLYGVK